MTYLGNGTSGADAIALLDSPVDGLGFRLQLFDHATESLDVVCHTIHTGPSTSAFFHGLLSAANRGVRVRILLDGKASCIRPSVLKMMQALHAHPNIECRRYNPISLWKPWKWHFLMHDKYILADGRYLLLGGRNIGDKFFAPDDYSGKISNDRDVVVAQEDATASAGQSVLTQTQDYFDQMWNLRDTFPLTTGAKARRHAAAALASLQAEASAFRQKNPAYYEHTFEDYRSRVVPTQKITLLHNPPEAHRKSPWIAQQLYQISLDAKVGVMLQTPYVTSNQLILAALRSISRRVPLALLTNSIASTPNYPAYSNYYSKKRKFIQTGAKIYEYQNAHSIHGKAMVVDKRLGIVGSFNMDDRSMYLDTEVMLVVDSEAFAGMVADSIQAYMRQSIRADEAGSPMDTDPSAVSAPMYKAPLLRVVSLFSQPFRSFI